MFANNSLLIIAIFCLGCFSACKQSGTSRVLQEGELARVDLAVLFEEKKDSEKYDGYKELVLFVDSTLDLEPLKIRDIKLQQLESDPESFPADTEVFEPSLTPLSYKVSFALSEVEDASCFVDKISIPSASGAEVPQCENLPKVEPEEADTIEEIEDEELDEDFFPSKIPAYNPLTGPLCTTGVDCNCETNKFYMCRYFGGGDGCYNSNNKCNHDNDIADRETCLAKKKEFNEHYLKYAGKTLTTNETKVLNFAKNDESLWCDSK